MLGCVFLLFRRRPLSTLFPYTTLFRSSPASFSAAGSRSSATRRAWGKRRNSASLWPPRPSVQSTTTASGWSSAGASRRSEEHTSELQSPDHLVCRLLLEKKNVVTPLQR